MTGLLLVALTALPRIEEAPVVSFSLAKTAVTATETFSGKVSVTFSEGLHGYQNPPSDQFQIPVVVSVAGKKFKLIKAKYPEGIDLAVGGDTKPARVYEGTVEIPVTLKGVKLKPGSHSVDIQVSYQQCNETSCYPPGTVNVSAKVKVVAKAAKS